MKEFVQRKGGPLYVVSAPRSASDVFDFTPISLDRSFQNWLRAVEATEEWSDASSPPAVTEDRLSESRPQRRALQLCPSAVVESEARPAEVVAPPAESTLTTQDYVQVMLATIRESVRHVSWPKEVVARFLATDVIARRDRDDAGK